MRFYIAQAIGVIVIGVFLINFHFKDMKRVRLVKMLADILWASHYLLLGAYTAFGTNLVCLLREVVFINSDKHFFSGKVWLYIFIGFTIVSGALTWQGPVSLLPTITSCIGTYSFWQKSVPRARILALTNNVTMFTYDIFVKSYTGLVAESLAFVSVLIAIFRNRKSDKVSGNGEVASESSVVTEGYALMNAQTTVTSKNAIMDESAMKNEDGGVK